MAIYDFSQNGPAQLGYNNCSHGSVKYTSFFFFFLMLENSLEILKNFWFQYIQESEKQCKFWIWDILSSDKVFVIKIKNYPLHEKQIKITSHSSQAKIYSSFTIYEKLLLKLDYFIS